MTLVGRFAWGPLPSGWNRLPLPPDLSSQLASGLYYYRAQAEREAMQGKPFTAKAMVLR